MTDSYFFFFLHTALLLASIDGFKIKRIQGIEGFVDELKFDHNSYAYGVVTQYVPAIQKCPTNNFNFLDFFPPAECNPRLYQNPKSRLLFKLDANKNVLWKIELNGMIQDDEFHIFYVLRKRVQILINRQNVVYLILLRSGFHYDLYKLETAEGSPLLKKVSEIRLQKQDDIDFSFVVDDKIIIAGYFFSRKSSGQRTEVTVLNANSDKPLATFFSEKVLKFIEMDREENIYFTIVDEKGQESLVVLTRDSLRKKNPTVKKIEGVLESKNAEVIDLKVGNQNEIYIAIYDRFSSHYVFKVYHNRKLSTVFLEYGPPPQFQIVSPRNPFPQTWNVKIIPTRSGAVIKNCNQDFDTVSQLINRSSQNKKLNSSQPLCSFSNGPDLCSEVLANAQPLDNFENMHLNDKNSLKVLNNDSDLYTNVRLDEGHRWNLCRLDQAISDNEVNTFFGGAHLSEKSLLLFSNATTGKTDKIRFEPAVKFDSEFSFPFFETKILFDERENLWFLFYFGPLSHFGPNCNLDWSWGVFPKIGRATPNRLYLLKKGTSNAQLIFNSDNVTWLENNQRNEILIRTTSGLFYNSLSYV